VTLDADFWWLSPAADPDFLVVGVGHTEPLRDDDKLGLMIRPLSASSTELLRPLSGLQQWRAEWSNENIYRTLRLFDREGQPALFGPFYLDLDADDGPDGTPDLAAAAGDARRCVELLRAEGTDERAIKKFGSPATRGSTSRSGRTPPVSSTPHRGPESTLSY